MSTAERQILTPGEVAQPAAPAAEALAVQAPERKKPGPKPRAAQPAAQDDLAEFDNDELPPAAEVATAAAPAGVAFTPEQQRVIAAMIAQAVQASKSSQDPATAAKLAAAANTPAKLPSQAEAHAMCEDSVARNIRPRPVLTTDGWYVHPEMTRVVDHGVARLQVS
jgi:hypothetical protein